ncbi:cysteine-rich KTR protein [Kineothrix alysoides]|uniref:Cysteine-rich KTR protein n=1 Tax=Kineothrix alysoides TaxID=1469948 RepID=A0A4V2QAW3_9FIRM|nr:cysteine-rich KTR domain-containing protein [Kineothrix alysoides]TCL54092.1 cysteine-rich KTR protein [Kineothrix alysoides]
MAEIKWMLYPVCNNKTLLKIREDTILEKFPLPADTSVEVENLEVFQEKLKDLSIIFPVTQIGGNWVSEFGDSEGNHIELTAPVSLRQTGI